MRQMRVMPHHIHLPDLRQSAFGKRRKRRVHVRSGDVGWRQIHTARAGGGDFEEKGFAVGGYLHHSVTPEQILE